MSNITTRAAKGSTLSHAEADANFTNLNNTKMEHVEGLTALRALTPKTEEPIYLTYRSTLGIGGGVFYWDGSNLNAEVTADTASGVFVAPDSDPTGASGAWVRVWGGRATPEMFGAVGDGVADDHTAIQAAADFVGIYGGALYFSAETYLVGSSVSIVSPIDIYGVGTWTYGTIVAATAGLNAPIFDISARCRIQNLSILGNDDGLKTLQAGAQVSGTNAVKFEGVFFINNYDSIKITGATPAFYLDINHCDFDGCSSAHLVINNTSAAGVDLIINDSRFLGDMPAYCWYFVDGLGSIIADNVQISVTGTPPANELIYFGTPAALYGGAQISNCVFEGGTTRFVGTAILPWKEVHIGNTLLTGHTGRALKIGYSDGIFLDNCTLSSSDATGIVEFVGGVVSNSVKFTSCSWESGSTGVPLYAGADSTIALYVSDPSWDGSAAFINFAPVSAVNLKLSVLGGDIGSNATPIVLNDYKNTEKNVQAFGDNFGPLQRTTLVGVLDGAGSAVVAHGVYSGQTRIVTVSAYYKGGSGEALPLVVVYADGTNVSVSGGTAAAKYRILVEYNTDVDTNW